MHKMPRAHPEEVIFLPAPNRSVSGVTNSTHCHYIFESGSRSAMWPLQLWFDCCLIRNYFLPMQNAQRQISLKEQLNVISRGMSGRILEALASKPQFFWIIESCHSLILV